MIAGHHTWVNTDPLLVGHDLVVDGSTTLEQLRLGLARRYQRHFAINPIIGYERLNLDLLGTGILGFQSNPAWHPIWGSTIGGLTVSVDRPAGTPAMTSVSHFAAIRVGQTLFNSYWGPLNPQHGRFALFGTFRRAVQDPLNGFVNGAWAPALLLDIPGRERPLGATCQFRTSGTRLNVPGLAPGAGPNRPDLPASVASRISDPVNPSPFTLIFACHRGHSPSGVAHLLVDQEIVDSATFDFPSDVTHVDNILMGVGSVGGEAYTAKVDLIDLQIWVPPFAQI